MTSDPRSTYQINFQCGHVAHFSQPTPKVGDYILCRRCAGYRLVSQVLGDWWFRCEQCTAARNCGTSQYVSKIKASKHSRERGHRAIAYQSGNKEATLIHFDPLAQISPLFEDGEEVIPF